MSVTKNGKITNPPKFGKSVSFNFGQGAFGEEFRLEVYKAKKKLLSDEWEAKKWAKFLWFPPTQRLLKFLK